MAASRLSQLPPITPAGSLARQAVDGLLPCLAGAVERREPYGVWGGEIFDHGTITARKRPRGRPPASSRADACLR